MLLLDFQVHSNRSIADQLSISHNTVNRYIQKAKDLRKRLGELSASEDGSLGELLKAAEAPTDDRPKAVYEYFPEVLKQSKQAGFTYQAFRKGIGRP